MYIIILCGICSNLHDILHFQHQFFEIFLSVLGFSKGKIHFFPKVLKKWSSCQKNGYHFLGGGVRTQSDKYPFFFLTLPLLTYIHPRDAIASKKSDIFITLGSDPPPPKK